MADNELLPKEGDATSSSLEKEELDPCPHCGASGAYPAIDLAKVTVDAVETAGVMAALASSTGSLPAGQTESLSKWEQDTYRDIISNVNNTLRFQIQLAVPILAGCVTALNMVPPQEHMEFLNNYDRFVFIPVLLSMGVSYYALELHWGLEKGKPTDNHEVLSKLVKRKYLMMHTGIVLQAIGLILLFVFVLMEFK